MNSKQKNVSMSLEVKLEIISKLRNKESTKTEICNKYGCCKSTINRILRNEQEIIKQINKYSITSKRIRHGKCKEVEDALLKWFKQSKAAGDNISANTLMEKSKQFAILLDKEFKPSKGWLWRWMKREQISLKKVGVEMALTKVESFDDDNFFDMVVPNLIENYSPQDIFNVRESCLFYKALPSSNIYKNYNDEGNEMFKDRLTLLFICNAAGDYKKVVVIGKPQIPHCFKDKKLPLSYFCHRKAWIVNEIWIDVLKSIDEEMMEQNREIILFVNNTGCYRTDTTLRNVTLKYFPVNTVPILQPLDQGIIHSFKTYFRRNLLKKQILAMERGISISRFCKNISILDAINMVERAWWMVKPMLITECFKKASFISIADLYDEKFIIEDFTEQNNFVNEVLNEMSQDEFENYVTFDDNIDCFGVLSDNEIVKEISWENKFSESMANGENAEVTDTNIPSFNNVLDSISTLQTFFLYDNKVLDLLDVVENEIMKNCRTETAN